MLYDLKTRLGIDELATCSALTVSDSRAQHFNALSQLEKILGVRCFESLAEFIDWLRPETELDLPQQPVGFDPVFGGPAFVRSSSSGTGQSSPSLPSGRRADGVLSRPSPKRTSW